MSIVRARRIAIGFSALFAFALAVVSTGTLRGAEPAADFLAALRKQGYHDIALEYLELAKTSKAFDAEFKQNLQYELGVTLIDMAQSQRNERGRDQFFERAIAELDGFIKNNAGKPKINDARNRLTELNVLRALGRIEQAARPSADKKKLLGEASAFFDEATKIIDAQQKEADAAFAKFKGFNPEKDKAKEADHNNALFDVVWSRLQNGQIEYMRAKLHTPASAEHTAQLKKAAAAFNKVYTDYQKLYYYGSLKARLSEGRCYQDMGDLKQAATLYDECLGGPADPDIFRDLKTKTFAYVCEVWVDPKINKPDAASERGGEWLIQMRPNEARDPDWLAVRYYVARSKEEIAKRGKDGKPLPSGSPPAPTPAMRNQLIDDAIRIVRPVAAAPNPLRTQAQQLLDRLSGQAGGEREAPKTFAEAKQRGDDLFGSIRSKMFVVDKGKEDLANSNLSAAEVKEIKDRMAAAEKEIAELQPKVIELFQLALTLARPNDKLDDINTVRFNLCLVYYQQDKLFEAATIGEYLLRRFPRSPGGRPASKIALACWSKLNGDRVAKKEDNKFELARMAGVAKLILATWTDKETANDTNVLIANIMVEQGQYDEAEKALEKVDNDFPKKAAAMMSLGQALARQYFTQKKAPDGERPADEELGKMMAKAQALMEEGIKRMDEQGTVSPNLVNAAYSLAQIYIDDSKAAKAVPLIEHAKYGPLTLLEAKNPLVLPPNFKSPDFEIATYNLALRAYIGALSDNPEMLAKAEKAIAKLEKLVDSEALMFSYTRMAQELKKQMAAAPEAQKQSIASGYMKFLVKMRDGGNASNYNTLAYILKSFEGLAEGVSEEGKPLSPQAKSYYEEAVKTGEKIIALVDEKKIETDENKMLAVRAVLAKCASRTGNVEVALDMYEAILGAKPYMLSVQVDAAMAYQEMGRTDSKYYKYALGGGRPGAKVGEKAKIWGWTQISKIALKNPKFNDVFHESRYQMCVCYYELGKATEAERSKNIYFNNAKKATMAIYKQFPTMGGPELMAKYDRLMKLVQKELGETQAGLAEFGPPTPADQAAK